MSPAPAQPDAAELLRLERDSRRYGSGLGRADLQGSWRLQRIWKRGQQRPAELSGVLLRGLAARLLLSEASSAAPGSAGVQAESGTADAGLQLDNAVRLAGLELRFQGRAVLEGRRPLLLLQFERWQLRCGHRVLLQGNVPVPPRQRQAFFALIAAGAREDPLHPGRTTRWLAARGRGGGLALWSLEPHDG